ncbi:glucokinase [Actinomadura parmotrematis]|uniref:Glucokinase n=1 Tax=Actinomadura parmotrematis TaxID=2864039 RepID=A0ABS7FPI9_9ACTN|nr:glucokinase [Actinomadura parmotrematis]MBW8482287.1 glucokinase [Actinomadura parmotrematis]
MSPIAPLLVADVGGTNARFALVEDGEIGRAASLRTRAFPGLAEAAEAYLSEHAAGRRPRAACLAVAGPVGGGTFRLTNAGWGTLRTEDVRRRLGLDRLDILNDFEALALALPELDGDDLVPIGGTAVPSGDGTRAVLGPGTGLGVAGLVRAGGGWLPLPTEGGQVDVAVRTDREVEVMRLLRAELGTATAENLLSGAGLTRIHRMLGLLDGTPAPPLEPGDICARADDPLCAETLAVFCALLGAHAGNVAMTLGARGGVYLGGGILPRITGVLQDSEFRARFEERPPIEEYMRAIPTALIVHPGPALVGAAARLAQSPTDLETV